MADHSTHASLPGQQGTFSKFRVNLPRKTQPPFDMRRAQQSRHPQNPQPQVITHPQSPVEHSPNPTIPINQSLNPSNPPESGSKTQPSTPTISVPESDSSKVPKSFDNQAEGQTSNPQNITTPLAETRVSNPPKPPNPRHGPHHSNPPNHNTSTPQVPWPPHQAPYVHPQYQAPPSHPGPPHYPGPPQYPGPPPHLGMPQHHAPPYYSQHQFHPPPYNPDMRAYHNFAPNQTPMPPPNRALPPQDGEPSPAVESKTHSRSRAGRTRGKQLTRKEDALLIEVCNKNRKAYGRKDLQTEFWNLIVDQFQALVQRPYPYKSVQRRMKVLMEARKQEIADYKSGDERREDDWTRALDKWIRHVDLHDLEQQSSRKRSLGEYLDETSPDEVTSDDGEESESDPDRYQTPQLPDEAANPDSTPIPNGTHLPNGDIDTARVDPPLNPAADEALPESPGPSTPGTTPAALSTRDSSVHPTIAQDKAEKKVAAKQRKRGNLLRGALHPRKRKRTSGGGYESSRGGGGSPGVVDTALASIAESFKTYVNHLINNTVKASGISPPTSVYSIPVAAGSAAAMKDIADRLARVEDLLLALPLPMGRGGGGGGGGGRGGGGVGGDESSPSAATTAALTAEMTTSESAS